MSKKRKHDDEPEEEEPEDEEEEQDEENLSPWEKQQRKKGKDPENMQKEYMGMARELLDEMKAGRRPAGLAMMPMMIQESKELRQAYADLNHADWDERCTLSIAKVVAANNSNPEQVAQIAFDIVQAVKAKFKDRKDEIQARIKKEQEKSPADHGTLMSSPGRIPPGAHGEI